MVRVQPRFPSFVSFVKSRAKRDFFAASARNFEIVTLSARRREHLRLETPKRNWIHIAKKPGNQRSQTPEINRQKKPGSRLSLSPKEVF